MRSWTLTMITAAALIGCDHVDTNGTMPVDGTQPDSTAQPDAMPSSKPAEAGPPSQPPAPDNTGINERDANRGATKTPIDQGNTAADTKITAEIRQRIVDTPDMSIDARNVKVITAGGRVTLRGPVSTEAERDTIVKIAKDAAGEGNVDSQLELAKGNP